MAAIKLSKRGTRTTRTVPPPPLTGSKTSATRLSPLMMRLNSSKETVIETSSSPKAIICLSVASSALALTRSIAVLSSLRSMSPEPSVSIESKTARSSASSNLPGFTAFAPVIAAFHAESTADLRTHVASTSSFLSEPSSRRASRAISGVSAWATRTMPIHASRRPSGSSAVASRRANVSISLQICRDESSGASSPARARGERLEQLAALARPRDDAEGEAEVGDLDVLGGLEHPREEERVGHVGEHRRRLVVELGEAPEQVGAVLHAHPLEARRRLGGGAVAGALPRRRRRDDLLLDALQQLDGLRLELRERPHDRREVRPLEVALLEVGGDAREHGHQHPRRQLAQRRERPQHVGDAARRAAARARRRRRGGSRTGGRGAARRGARARPCSAPPRGAAPSPPRAP